MASASSLKAAIVDRHRDRKEKEAFIQIIRRQLTALEHRRAEILSSLTLEFTNESNIAVASILQHFRNPDTRRRLVDYWTENTCPDDHGDAQGLHKRQEYFINKRFRQECEDLEKRHQTIKNVQKKLISAFTSHFVSINRHLSNIHKALTDTKSPPPIVFDSKQQHTGGSHHAHGLSTGTKVGMALALPLLLPIGMVAGVIVGVKIIKKKTDDKKSLHDYRTNKVRIMKEMTKNMLPEFTKEDNIRMIVSEQLQDVRAGVFHLIITTIPNIVKADTEFLEELITQKNSTNATLMQDLQPKLEECMELVALLDLHQIKYAKPKMLEADCVTWEEKGEPLGEGYFGKIYNGRLFQRGGQNDVTLRVLYDLDDSPDTASAVVEESRLFE